MKLSSLLSERQASLAERWRQRLFESYAPSAAVFLKKENNPFDNPVGHQLTEGLRRLLEAIVQEMDRDRILAALDEVIRIRALQNIAPSQAMAFIFLLKNVVREELAPELKAGQFTQELQEFDSRIDGVALLGFDVYTKCREKLYEIRVNEVKQRVSGFLRSKGMDVNGF